MENIILYAKPSGWPSEGGIHVDDNGHLIINEGTVISNGDISIGTPAYGTWPNEYPASLGHLTMNGGKITGGTSYFGAVWIKEGSFIMNEGEICDHVGVSYYSNPIIVAGGVLVSENASFIMNGGKIYNNSTNPLQIGAGGVCTIGDFEMNGGEIYNNTISASATNTTQCGGVLVDGDFIMNGGKIHDNYTANRSNVSGIGGVNVRYGTFTMNDGEIYGNKSGSGSYSGDYYYYYNTGGVRAQTFIMNNGKIFGNTSYYHGGGVNALYFTMTGGEIYYNNADQLGGGLYIWSSSGTVNKTGGIIYGSDDITKNNSANTVPYGHAIYIADKPEEAVNSTVSGNYTYP